MNTNVTFLFLVVIIGGIHWADSNCFTTCQRQCRAVLKAEKVLRYNGGCYKRCSQKCASVNNRPGSGEQLTIPTSCKEILAQNSAAPSGVYQIATSTGRILSKVYCEMGLNGGGYTFLHPYDFPIITQDELNALFTDNASFLLRMRRFNGKQSYGILEQLDSYSSIPLSLQVNANKGYNTPQNVQYLGSNYLYFGFLPISKANAKKAQGVMVNTIEVPFDNCDSNPNSYFALFPNFSESDPSPYFLDTISPMYEALIGNLENNPSHRVIPDDFFTFFEIHFGGCGMYTQSDSRQDQYEVISANIGFR